MHEVDIEDVECEAERLEEVEEVECLQVADGDNVEERLEQIEDVDCMQVADVHCEGEGLKDIDDLECMHILDDDRVHDQADAAVECRKVLDQKDLDVQEVMVVPSLLGRQNGWDHGRMPKNANHPIREERITDREKTENPLILETKGA